MLYLFDGCGLLYLRNDFENGIEKFFIVNFVDILTEAFLDLDVHAGY